MAAVAVARRNEAEGHKDGTDRKTPSQSDLLSKAAMLHDFLARHEKAQKAQQAAPASEGVVVWRPRTPSPGPDEQDQTPSSLSDQADGDPAAEDFSYLEDDKVTVTEAAKMTLNERASEALRERREQLTAAITPSYSEFRSANPGMTVDVVEDAERQMVDIVICRNARSALSDDAFLKTLPAAWTNPKLGATFILHR